MPDRAMYRHMRTEVRPAFEITNSLLRYIRHCTRKKEQMTKQEVDNQMIWYNGTINCTNGVHNQEEQEHAEARATRAC